MRGRTSFRFGQCSDANPPRAVQSEAAAQWNDNVCASQTETVADSHQIKTTTKFNANVPQVP